MTLLSHEIRLFLRARLSVLAVILLTALTTASVIAGLSEINRQRAAIAAIAPAQAEDIGAVADWIDAKKDAGSAGYYSFHPTWDPPSRLAFAALGMRDVSPYILRVRALGLEAQIYDGDTFNPELALPGRFDFAFVLVFLAPLFVIALFHDLVSGEREAGRLRMLQALPRGGLSFWLRRGGLRLGLLWSAMAVPFLIAAVVSGVTLPAILAVVCLTLVYLLFWVVVCGLTSRLQWSSVANAATLAAAWLVLVLILPTLANVVVNRAIPVDQGAEIALAQREQVNRAWDIPRDETMRRFYAGHPEWADSPPLTEAFHYKWYFAFHQVGDERVGDQVRAYRSGLEKRDATAQALGWILPSVGVQALLTRLAETDLKAQFAYQNRIRAFHGHLRHFYYGYLFRDLPFAKADFARAPRFDPASDPRTPRPVSNQGARRAALR
jgi:ABC-2 type transport system permease protein